MGFPTKNDHFEVFWGYHNFRKHLTILETKGNWTWQFFVTPFGIGLLMFVVTLSKSFGDHQSSGIKVSSCDFNGQLDHFQK